MTDSIKKSSFSSENIINTHISESDLRTFFVGYDMGNFRYEKLCDYIVRALVDFCFGFHKGIQDRYTMDEIREAAKSLYSIKTKDTEEGPEISIFEDARKKYLKDEEYGDDEKFLKRGEFGELIMHMLLRDFLKTVPLLSKIYMKDSDGAVVHGFDAVHVGPSLVQPDDESLYLGESKLYIDPKRGITELMKDIEGHFTTSYLDREFILISKKQDAYMAVEKYENKNTHEEYKEFIKKKDGWFEKFDNIQSGKLKMKDLFKSVTVPLLCTYTSNVLSKHSDEETDDFKTELDKEIGDLRENFHTKLKKLKERIEKEGLSISTDLNIVLILFPVPSKKELVKMLHQRLHNAQQI